MKCKNYSCAFITKVASSKNFSLHQEVPTNKRYNTHIGNISQAMTLCPLHRVTLICKAV
jgi:hypothetical protein